MSLVVSDLKISRIQIQIASTTPSKSNKRRNVNTIRKSMRSLGTSGATQTGEIDDRKTEVIAFVVNSGKNIVANNFYI